MLLDWFSAQESIRVLLININEAIAFGGKKK